MNDGNNPQEGEKGPVGPLEIGTHKFPFTYPLSLALPSSFEGKYGWTRYTVTAVMDILNDETISFTQPFTLTTAHNFIRPYDGENYSLSEISLTLTYCLVSRLFFVVMT